MSLQLNKSKLIGKWTIAAAAIQGATTGHAYWIDATGALIDAGASIAAANPTNQPPINFDVSQYTDLQWSLFYGAQTSNVGGKIGIAEMWPTYPVDVVNTIPPFVRDVASHWLVTAGSTSPIQQRLPADTDDILYLVSQANTALDTLALDTNDYQAVYALGIVSAGTSVTAGFRVNKDGTFASIGAAIAAAAVTGFSIGLGATLPNGNVPTAPAPILVPPGLRFTTTAAGVGNTVTLSVLGERKRPLRKPNRIAPYIQWVNPGTGGAAPVVPTAGSQPIYLQLWGRIADGEVR